MAPTHIISRVLWLELFVHYRTLTVNSLTLSVCFLFDFFLSKAWKNYSDCGFVKRNSSKSNPFLSFWSPCRYPNFLPTHKNTNSDEAQTCSSSFFMLQNLRVANEQFMEQCWQAPCSAMESLIYHETTDSNSQTTSLAVVPLKSTRQLFQVSGVRTAGSARPYH